MASKIARRWLPIGLLAVLGSLLYALAGFQGSMFLDQAKYLYAGQQVLNGVPPYQSIWLQKGPLSPLVVAGGLVVGRLLGLDDVFASRALFAGFAILNLVVLYALIAWLSGSRRAALAASLTMFCMLPFHAWVWRGPEPKILMAPCEVLSLYLTSRRRWFWAGLCGALAGLTWQPMLVFPAVTLLLALLQPRPERRRAVLQTLAGGFLPLLLILAYFAFHGALYDLFADAVLFSLRYDYRQATTFVGHLLRPIQSVASAYAPMLGFIIIGLLTLAGQIVARVRRYRSWSDLTQDPLAPILLTLPGPILWSLKDFQGGVDFFVFLPYVALGCGLFLAFLLRRLDRVGARRLAWGLTLGVCVALSAVGFLQTVVSRGVNLLQQRQVIQTLQTRYGADARIFAINVPQAFVLTRQTSPTPYIELRANVFDVQEDRIPGGYAGWLQKIEAYDPRLIIIGEYIINGELAASRHTQEFMDWVLARYRKISTRLWDVYVKK